MRWRLTWAILLVFALPAAAEEPAITVKTVPPTVARKSFDPKNPPSDMPKLTPPEAGVCHFDFSCETQMGGDVEQTGAGQYNVTIDTITVTTRMNVVIWAVNDAPQKLLAHEDAHRQICEYYYKNSDVYARQLAKNYIGKVVGGVGNDKQSAIDNALKAAINELGNDLLAKTRVRCSACQKRFDAITNHGLKPIPEADAIKQAEAEDPEPDRH